MVVIEDFTKLPVGARVPTDGPVSECPRCGRNGVQRTRLDGSTRWVHVQTTELFGDGLRSEPADCCTLTDFAPPDDTAGEPLSA